MRRRGQVLVLAALLAGLLSAAVVATVAIGQRVHERVRLQHTADATAYSLAVAEARAFNLYARVNRAHASHDVSAMSWQSLLSYLFFTEAFLTDLTGLAHTFPCSAPRGRWVALCAALERVPAVAGPLGVLRSVTAALTEATRGYQRALNAGDDAIDRAVGEEVVPGFFAANGALTAIAQGVMRGTFAELDTIGAQVATENDPTVTWDADAFEAGAYSRCLFDRSHQEASLGRPSAPVRDPFVPLAPGARRDRDPVARAKRSMAAVANATRQGCEPGSPAGCPDTFLTARTRPFAGPLPPGLGVLRGWLAAVPKWGQTRLLSSGLGGADGQSYLREPDGAPDVPTGMLAQGDNLGADDGYVFPLGPFACGPRERADRCWGDPRRGRDARRPFRAVTKTSIWALNADERTPRPGGVHWRVAYPGHPLGPGHVAPRDLGDDAPQLRELGLHEARRRLLGGVPVSVFVANVRPIQDGHHPWPGVAPYPSFEPGHFARRCGEGGDGADGPEDRPATREADFNQPSVWVALHKTPGALRAAGDAAGSAAPPPLRLASGTARLEIEPERAPEGMHAFARAQVYYHRPGDWSEHPSFFNPFWRARLAATLQGTGLPPPLRRWRDWVDALPAPLRATPERVLTH